MEWWDVSCKFLGILLLLLTVVIVLLASPIVVSIHFVTRVLTGKTCRVFRDLCVSDHLVCCVDFYGIFVYAYRKTRGMGIPRPPVDAFSISIPSRRPRRLHSGVALLIPSATDENLLVCWDLLMSLRNQTSISLFVRYSHTFFLRFFAFLLLSHGHVCSTYLCVFVYLLNIRRSFDVFLKSHVRQSIGAALFYMLPVIRLCSWWSVLLFNLKLCGKI